MPTPEHPKVFISYSHDSQEHLDRVLTLSDRLRGDGIDCHIDQYEVSPPEGWPNWMVNQIEDADFVLVVCTEPYERRFRGKEEPGKGLGARWEGAIITQEIYDDAARNTTFIPVLFSPDDSAHIPIVLRGVTRYNLNTEAGYGALYRRLTNQPLIQKPELGKIRPMPPLARKQPTHEQPRSDIRTGTPQEDAERISDGKGDAHLARTPVTAPRRPRARSTARQPFEPELILIPAGEFLMGSDPQQDEAAYDAEQPQHRLYLPDYYLAKTPVTNAQYLAFVQETHDTPPRHWTEGRPPRGKEDHPVVEVSWYDAMEYCRWLSRAAGKSYSLSSEAEWEKGARGIDGRIYPWGDGWDTNQSNSKEGGQEDTTPVEAYPQGTSPYGVLDMAGNVWEWTRSLWGRDVSNIDFRYPYNPEDGRENLHAPKNASRIARGGAFWGSPSDVRCALRYCMEPDSQSHYCGFRVVMHP
jgi:formylglycine-generating enzyme required for sulfatase activity